MAFGPMTSWKTDGEKMETVTDFIFLGSRISADDDCSHEIKSCDQPRQHIKKQRHHFANKGPCSQSYGFSSSHVWMWELDHKEKLGIKELMLLNYGAGEDSWESLEQQGDPASPS